MTSRLIHPRLMATLEQDFFATYCTIEQAVESQDSMGGVVPTWGTLFAYLPCRIAPAGGGERRQTNQIVLESTHTIVISGTYAITSKMRAVVEDVIYDILLVERDSEWTMTRLNVRIVR